MRLELNRNPSVVDTTFGTLHIDEQLFCSTLEDELREVPGEPVEQWKVKHQTAIAAGTYRLALRDSPKFGPDTLWVKDVEGFEFILIHSGEDKDSTDGCIIVGDQVDLEARTIHGGKARGVLAALKHRVVPVLKSGAPVFIVINNPPGYEGPDAQEEPA